RAAVALGLGVERLDELHDVHAVLTERRAHWGRRARLAADGLELDLGENFFRHLRGSSAGHPVPRSERNARHHASLLNLLDLVEADLDRRLATEDGDQDLELLSIVVDLGDL